MNGAGACGLVALLAIAGVAGAAIEAESTVKVEGRAAIERGDAGAARELALRAAMREAVVKVVGTVISTESQHHEETIERESGGKQSATASSNESYQEAIVAKSQGFIKTYDIVSERRDGDTLIVEIRATVSTQSIRDDLSALGLLLRRVGNPRVAVVRSTSGPEELSIAQALIAGALRKKSFNVVDAGTARVDAEAPAAQTLGSLKAAGADVAIVITGSVGAAGEGTEAGQEGLEKAFVSLDLRAVRTDSGGVLARGLVERMNGVGGSRAEALKSAFGRAAPKATDELVTRLTEAWNTEETSGRIVTVRVTAADYGTLGKLRVRLSRFTGVRAVQQASYEAGVGTLQVTCTSTTQALADRITSTDFAPLTVEVSGVTPSTIDLKAR